MKHIIFLDDLEKLNIKKDSTLQLALTLKNHGHEVYLLFEDELFFRNEKSVALSCTSFSGEFERDGICPKEINLLEKSLVELDESVTFHMRLDPPFDSRYLRYLWIIDALKRSSGMMVLNDAKGICHTNEKIEAYLLKNNVESFVGSSVSGFEDFVTSLKSRGVKEIVLKPLDLFQGIGVQKFPISDHIVNEYLQYIKKYEGAVVAQPFLESVVEGEIRSIFFKSHYVGSIIKTPKKGDFVSNIAGGASYSPYVLDGKELGECQKISKELETTGLPWVAFDLLDGKVQEVNITCPGLLVEVSKAHHRNLAEKIISLI